MPSPIPTHPLHPSTFAPYGHVLQNPHAPSLATSANRSTALKYAHISPLTDAYHDAPSGVPGRAAMSLFVCRGRNLRPLPSEDQTPKPEPEIAGGGGGIFDVDVMERHPYTTQTFVPLAASPERHARYLVVVAPSRSSSTEPGRRAPDLANLRAFVGTGGQGVTYGVGTWHAPMVALGREVEFVVTQFENGVPGEDCVECEVEGVEVRVRGERGRL